MGVAAYQRGSQLISRQIDAQQRPVEFEIMERLNGLQKVSQASVPFGPIQFVHDHHGWWIECPRTGFGFCYQSLDDAVRNWRVTITSYDQGRWIGTPGEEQ